MIPNDPTRPVILNGSFTIDGKVTLEKPEEASALKLTAFALDPGGEVLAKSEVTAKGNFKLSLNRKQVSDVTLLIGAGEDIQSLRRSSAYQRRVTPADWSGERNDFVFKPEISLPRDVWFPWLPQRICVSGHIRKIHSVNGGTDICPVPFVKVEVFDVDREGCWWPWIIRGIDKVIDRPVIRIPDLVRDFPIPIPEPDPPFFARPGIRLPLERAGFDPQPEPPAVALNRVALNPQPLPPKASLAVGEVATLQPEVAARIDKLTLTSKVAPWVFFPRCFYSRQLVCTATTDCNGYFQCCFSWFPFHVRRGRLRFDARPDIIIKVTQVINGVETVIYLDPYSSTRWNVTNAHIDLFLNDPEVICGKGCSPRPEGTTVFLARVGNDEVYQINQTAGTFAGGGLSNCAYGASLQLHAVFGQALTTGGPKRYYRLSVRKGGAAFVPLTQTLADTRVDKVTLLSQSYTLGPQVVNGTPALYEVRDMTNYYWYNIDLAGYWNTLDHEDDEGKYTLRLEVFDENGVKMTSAQVDYRDGTAPPPGPLPPMADRCDLIIQIDNKYPALDLQVPAAGGECGVVKWPNVPALTINTLVTQENGRLHSWSLSYVKGLTGISVGLASAANGAGLPTPSNVSTPGAPMTAGLTGTCAFALTLSAWPLVRNGYGLIHHTSLTKAIAVEKCS
jgi:hypothetical protein